MKRRGDSVFWELQGEKVKLRHRKYREFWLKNLKIQKDVLNLKSDFQKS